MTARVVHESLDGGSIAVGDTCRYVGCIAAHTHPVVIAATERGMGTAVLHLTRDESDDLIDALIARNQEIDAAALTRRGDTTDTRPPAPPVAEGREAGVSGKRAAHPGADAAPTGTTSGAPLAGGSRDQATGLSAPSAGSGRPTCEHGYRFENALCPVSTCGASAYVVPDSLVIDVAQAAAVATEVHGTDENALTLFSALGRARAELLANSTLIGPAGGEL